jgi:hypothetical protein
MKVSRLAKPFNGSDLVPFMHHGERETGIHPVTIDMDRTSTALAMVAPFLSAG